MLIATTRYTESDYVEIDDDPLGQEILTNNFLKALQDRVVLNGAYFYRIPIEQRYRKDLVSKTLYGTSDLYWVLELFNNLLYLEEWAGGVVIMAPAIPDIESAMQYVKTNGK